MDLTLRRLTGGEMDRLLELSIAAWEPVFSAWQRILGPELYPVAIYPDWRKGQRKVVEGICGRTDTHTWVAETGGLVVGFVCYSLNAKSRKGEVELLAVAPEHQNRGIGTRLNSLALRKMKEAGMVLAVAGTGGDDGHAPARRSYEKAGYTGLPLVRYYKRL